MISFASDYTEIGHPRILEALCNQPGEQNIGYGEDAHCAEARRLIKQFIGSEAVDVHFVVGGTQCNVVAISSFLRPHEGVVCAGTAHINVHETGAIEATGHKVLALPSRDGKLTAEKLEAYLCSHRDDPTHEHMVKPGMIYISNTTELGTVYRKEELSAIRKIADAWGLPVYADGARFGSAMQAPGQDLRPEDMPELFDAFSIGGTKNGLPFGEALILVNEAAKRDFRYIQKQKGAMLAKGWLLGLQFKEAFKDGLFMELAAHENKMAARLAEGLTALGLEPAALPESNQLFMRMPKALCAKLAEDFVFEEQEGLKELLDHGKKTVNPDETIVRFCTSWATKPESVDALTEACKNCLRA